MSSSSFLHHTKRVEDYIKEMCSTKSSPGYSIIIELTELSSVNSISHFKRTENNEETYPQALDVASLLVAEHFAPLFP